VRAERDGTTDTIANVRGFDDESSEDADRTFCAAR
jgi:hypothetical protein